MHVWSGTTNEVYPVLIRSILRSGQPVGPRGTQTLELSPVAIGIDNPEQRYITSYGRPINLAFALAEVLWILRGRRDVEMLSFYNESIKQFSDNGTTFNAPYGYRLRSAHGYDQIQDTLQTLTDDPDSRRATLVMWHPNDSGYYWHWDNPDDDYPVGESRSTKDRACNVLAHVMIRNNKLNWLQVVRSNDAILGVPYNFIQFCSLQEFMARRLGIEPGEFTYVADSMHLYTDGVYYPAEEASRIQGSDLGAILPPIPSMGVTDEELESTERLELMARQGKITDFGAGVFWFSAVALWGAHWQYRNGNDERAFELLKRTEPLWALIQMKFYWKKRWYKGIGENFGFLETIESMYGGDALEWLIEGDMARDE